MAKRASLLNTLEKNKEFILIIIGVVLLLFILLKCMNIFGRNDIEDEDIDNEDDDDEDVGDDDVGDEDDIDDEDVGDESVGVPTQESVEMASNGAVAASDNDTVVEGYYS